MITNKPQNNDPIVEVRTGPLGENIFVMSPLFSRFLDDLVTVTNSPDDDPQAPVSVENAHLRRLRNEVQDKLSMLCHENTQLKTELRDTKKALNDLMIRLENLEQIAWR